MPSAVFRQISGNVHWKECGCILKQCLAMDRRDLQLLLLRYPHLKAESGPVMECLIVAGANPAAIAEWKTWVASTIEPEHDEGY
jgi:hypothetical protein